MDSAVSALQYGEHMQRRVYSIDMKLASLYLWFNSIEFYVLTQKKYVKQFPKPVVRHYALNYGE
jgi:hypothetical protein